MGSGHLHWDAKNRSLGLLEVQGAIFPNGSGSLNPSLGQGFSASRLGVGLYQVVVEPQINIIQMACFPFLNKAIDSDVHLLDVEIDVATKSITLQHLQSSDTSTIHPAAADLAADPETYIAFLIKIWTTRAQGSGVP